MNGQRFLLTVLASTRYANELAHTGHDHPAHPLGYTFLTLLNSRGADAKPLPFTDSVSFARRRTLTNARAYAYSIRMALAGIRVVGMDNFGATVALAVPRKRSRVMAYCYTAAKPWPTSMKSRFAWKARSAGLRACDLVVFSTETERERAIELHRLKPFHTAVLLSGVDTDFFKPSDDPASTGELTISCKTGEHRLSKGNFIFVCGDMLRGDEAVFQAVAHLPVHLVRTSLHDMRPAYADLQRRYPDAKARVSVLQDVPYLQLRQLYQHATCCVVPTDNSWQPAGWTSLSEALSCGTTVCATDGINTIELDRMGGSSIALRWDLNAPQTLTRLIETLANEPVSRQAASNGLEFVRRQLSIDAVAQTFFESEGWQKFIAD